MEKISQLKFLAIEKNTQPVKGKALEAMVSQLENWEVVDYGGSDALYKTYKLKNFLDAQKLAAKLGLLAEKYSHHPILSYTWGKLEVYWFTHSLQGVHTNDIVLAQQTEALAQKSGLLIS